MTKGIEIQTVHQNTRDYIKKYRDIPKFLQFCKACPRYNRCWACPEHGFDTEQYIAAYSHVYIIGAKIPVPASLRQIDMSSEQIAQAAEGITKAARRILDPVLLSLEQHIPNSLACYGGTCQLCETCTRPEGKPCRFPEKRRPSLEAIGFDVAATTQDLLGIELLWCKDELPPYLTVISALFTRDAIFDLTF